MALQYTYDTKGRQLGVFIPIGEWKKMTKKYKELAPSLSDDLPPSKKEILQSIKTGLEEVKLHRQGKLKLKTAKQLLDEL